MTIRPGPARVGVYFALTLGVGSLAVTAQQPAPQPAATQAGPTQPAPAQPAPTQPAPASASQPGPPPLTPQQEQQRRETAADHRQMMEQLGIKALRPGPSGNESAPNPANYDEAQANPFPDLPEVLTLEERPKGHEGRGVVEAAAPRDRRGLRARSARPRSGERRRR